MAHFCELDDNNIVLRVVVIGNRDTADASGVEKEHIGAAFCERLFGGRWVQTSYNGNKRKNYAGIGYTFRTDIDAFVAPQPYPSWVLNDKAQWEAPVPMPEAGEPPKRYSWDEETVSWVEVVE